MRAPLAIAGVELRRFLRDRSNIFFVFLFPLLLVLVIGAQFGGGGGQGSVTVSGSASALRGAVVQQLEDRDLSVVLLEPQDAREQLARGRADVGLFLDGSDADDYTARRPVELATVPAGQQGAQVTMEQVRAAVTEVAIEQGQLLALESAGVPAEEARAALETGSSAVDPPRLAVVDVDEVSQELSGLGQFDLGAAGQMLLFVFLISAAGSTTLIQARHLGVLGRTLSAPVSAGQALTGQALGRFTIAMFQGAYIMLATAVLFDVSWGNLWLSLLVLAVFSAVAAGAAMLIGSLVDNDGAASGLGIGLGLVLAALGGSMLPLELFPDTLRTVAHVTPHAWAYDAFAQIQRHEGTLVDILLPLSVLVGMAAVLLTLGTWTLRRSLVRAM
ncbi:ABC transporter permease [Georgenia sp. 10Sc9-8]|uniref:ABC transporter permease n=1 Tax=Georgenia halotolerans TaxID=3028317 RepID=A0ABT5TW73_9MICO|nr:ABC transporter permease [Georgenia halotolerans]